MATMPNFWPGTLAKNVEDYDLYLLTAIDTKRGAYRPDDTVEETRSIMMLEREG
jgi:hypothetical protein